MFAGLSFPDVNLMVVGRSWRLTSEGRTCEIIMDLVSTYIRSHSILYLSLKHRRVCEVKLNGDHTFELKQQKYRVSDTLKTGDAKVLFGVLIPLLMPL
jgi:hypothetical protein